MKNKFNQSKGTTTLYSTSRNSIIKDFITTTKDMHKTDNFNLTPATYNKYGFIVGLHDGYVSDGNKRLERVLPENVDLSLNQSGGFSISLWFLNRTSPGGVHRFILKKGNSLEELTPSIGILPNGENLFVKIMSSKHKLETLYSTKVIEPNRLYNLTATFSIDHINGLSDISLYIDGLLDSQVLFFVIN